MQFEIPSSHYSHRSTDAKINLVNKGSHAEVQILKSKHPVLVSESAIADLINRYTYNQYAPSCTKYDIKSFANNQLSAKIDELEKALAEMKLIRKIARRKDIKFIDMTGGKK